MIDRVETGLFMRQSGPCVICGDTNYALSCGGPTICPKCDCGQFDAATVEKQARVIADLRAQLAKSCDNGRFEDSDWVCPRAAKGIEVDYLNPLLDTMKRLSENIITHKQVSA